MLVVRDQLVDQRRAALVVAVVVRRAVDDQQVALELIREGDGRAVPVALGVVLRQAHVALLVDRVVEALVADGGDGHGRVIELGIAEDGVEAHRSAAAPAPDADPLRVRPGPLAQEGPGRGGLVGRGQDPHLPVDALAPLATARRGRAAVVHAHHQVPPARQHPVPQPGVPAPAIEHGLARGLAVDVDEQRPAPARIEVRGLDAPGVQQDPLADVDPEEAGGTGLQLVQPRAQSRVVLDHALARVSGQAHQLDQGGRSEGGVGVEGPPAIGRDPIGVRARLLHRGQPLGLPAAVQPDPIQVALRGILGRGGVVQPAALLVDPLDPHDVEGAGGQQVDPPAVPGDAPDVPPAVALARPQEAPSSVQPGGIARDVDPGLVALGQNGAGGARAGVGEDDLVLVLEAVEALEDDLLRAGRPLHPGDVVLAGIARERDPAGLPPLGADHPHAAGGVALADLGVGEAPESRVEPGDVVDQAELAHALGVDLPVGDPLAVGAPAEAAAQPQLLLVHPVGGAVDDRLGRGDAQAVDLEVVQVLDPEVPLADVGHPIPGGREAGEHQGRLLGVPTQLP